MVKAIGKGSIASIFTVILNIVRVFLWIIVFAIGMDFVSIAVFETSILQELPFTTVDLSGDRPVALTNATILFVRVYVMLYVANRLLEVLRALRLSSPFIPENADRLTRIAAALAIGEIIQYSLAIFGQVTRFLFDLSGDIDMEVKLQIWFFVLVVMVFAAVFREGARMKQDQDLTI